MTEAVVELAGVSKSFQQGSAIVHALSDVSLSVGSGELVALHGRSGSGKTTLLHIVGGLEQPDVGDVRVLGRDLADLSDDERSDLRRDDVAFIFQSFGLLPVLSAQENVEVPLRLRGVPERERRDRVYELMGEVGLIGRAHHRPNELSGGEQQRVAIARALANDPAVLIADEPTGQLDSQTGRSIVNLIARLVEGRDMAALIATHDPSIVRGATRTIELQDGRLAAPAPR